MRYSLLVRRLVRLPFKAPGKLLAFIRQLNKRSHCSAHPLAVLHEDCRINNNRIRSAIQIGRGSHVLAALQTLQHGGHIEIGDFCYLGERSYVWSSERIVIGHRVLISHGVNIHDNVSHPLSARARHEHYRAMIEGKDLTALEGIASAEITIGDDAWIGFNATILKGVNIGRGAIVGACSLVTVDVPDWAIVVGNPARIIGSSKP